MQRGTGICNYLRQQRLVPICQHVPANPIDDYVILNFFEALKPIELDAYTKTIVSQVESEKKINKSHAQQLERLKYQAKLAERQFNLVDPDNRLVAAEVEKRWEQALHELKLVETECARKQKEKVIPELSQELKKAFVEIGKKLPDIWDQSILSRQQKKAFLRCLIDKVIVHRMKPDILQVRIVWKGGETTTANIPVAVGSLAMLSSLEDFEQAIIKLSKVRKTDLEIAQCLTKQGYRSPMKKEVVESTVRIIRLKNGIFRKKSQSHPLKVPGYLSVSQLAGRVRVPIHWIYDRIHNGQIKADKCNDSVKGKYLFADTPETIKMLKCLKRGKK